MSDEMSPDFKSTVEDGIVLVTVPVMLLKQSADLIEALKRENAMLAALAKGMLDKEQQKQYVPPAPFAQTPTRPNGKPWVNPKDLEPFWDVQGKIPTIKRIREYTGLGLKEAKDLADAWEQSRIPSSMGHDAYTRDGTWLHD